MGIDELKELAVKIQEKKILVQLPAGLMPRAGEIEGFFRGKKVFFSAHPCFGACDVQEFVAQKIGATAILNIGHSRMDLKTRIPLYFIEWRLPFPDLPQIKGLPKKVGLVTTIQYVYEINRFRQQLESQGYEVYIGMPGQVCTYRGQVSGCDIRSATSISHEVGGFLFIGSSRFHSLKIAVDCQKPVWLVDEAGNIKKIDENEVKMELRKMEARKSRALEHKSYGLLVSTKLGQFRLEQAEQLKKKLEKMGKKALVIVGNIFRSEEIGNFDVDAFVTTACPRLVDDYEAFGKPIYSLEDF